MCLDQPKWNVACSLTMTRAVGMFGKHLKHPAGKCRGFLQFQHHSALLQWTVNISCTLFLFFGVIKDFIDAELSGTELFHSRFTFVNCNCTLASSLTSCLFILTSFLGFWAQFLLCPRVSQLIESKDYKWDLNVAPMIRPEYKRCYWSDQSVFT